MASPNIPLLDQPTQADVQALVESWQSDTRSFVILGDEVTLHRATGLLRSQGVVTGVQQGLGDTYYAEETVKVNEVAPFYLAALENENHPSHDYVSSMIGFAEDEESKVDLARRLGLPFDGYDDMDLEDILAAMRVLPSTTVQAIKQYEKEHEGRVEILNYSIGFGESPEARQTGVVSSDLADADTSKAVGRIRTRQTPAPADEVIAPGEGITGTGEPAIPHGAAAAEEKADDGSGDTPMKKVARRSRSARSRAGKSGDDGNPDDDTSGSGAGE